MAALVTQANSLQFYNVESLKMSCNVMSLKRNYLIKNLENRIQIYSMCANYTMLTNYTGGRRDELFGTETPHPQRPRSTKRPCRRR